MPQALQCKAAQTLSSPALQDHVGGLLRRHRLHAFVAERACVYAFEESLAAAEQDGRDYEVQFVDQALAQVLLDGVRAAADAHVFAGRGLTRAVERFMDPAGDEMVGT